MFNNQNICNMKKLLILIFTGFFTFSNAQNISEKNFERKGFIFSTAFGISSVGLNFPSYGKQNEISASLPNFKIGAMISEHTALLVYLPGSIYTYKNEGRKRDRGFEGIIPSVQYWLKERWWVLGGAGLGLDAPVFYDIKNEEERKFYFGGSVVAATGYEIWRKGRCTIDVQSRIHYGTANLTEGSRKGMAFNFLVGFNWY